MATVDSNGFTRKRLDEILAELQAGIQDIYGTGINIDPDSPDGQLLGLFANALSDIEQALEDVYISFHPQSATGVALSRVVQYNGIRRIAGTSSTATVTLSGTAGTLVPEGSQIKSTSGDIFLTDNDATIGGGGTVTVGVTAQEFGPRAVGMATLTKIATPVYGWQSVTNGTAGTLGRSEETDGVLRVRRAASTGTPSQGIVDGVQGAIANLENVTQVRVYENFTGSVDANGLPAHSIQCIVEGGDDDEIAQAIWLKRSVGCVLVGDTSATAYDINGYPHVMNFDRPTDVDIYIEINLTALTGWPSDGDDRIKNAIVDWAQTNQKIGEDVIQSRLYEAVNSVPGHSVQDLFIGVTVSPTNENDIDIAYDELARFDIARIVVNVT